MELTMYKVSDIISMPIISLYECDYHGIIYNILFDCKLKKCKLAHIFNEEDNLQKVMRFAEVFKIGKDCIFVKNNTSLDLECNNEKVIDCSSPLLNLQVYDINGKNIGKCTDVEINKNFYIESIIVDSDHKIENKNIINIGKSAILIGEHSQLSRFRPRLTIQTKQPCNENKVIILDEIKIDESKNTQLTIPIEQSKIITDYKLLIGRTLTQDIKTLNGEIISKKDSIVTKEIINKASMYGKLIEIARYSTNKKLTK
jgi:sporulation protein YlmC with PRC-barrel domain